MNLLELSIKRPVMFNDTWLRYGTLLNPTFTNVSFSNHTFSSKELIDEVEKTRQLLEFYYNPLTSILQAHTPLFYKRVINYAEYDPFFEQIGIPKKTFNKILGNKTHVLFFEFMQILDAAGLDIEFDAQIIEPDFINIQALYSELGQAYARVFDKDKRIRQVKVFDFSWLSKYTTLNEYNSSSVDEMVAQQAMYLEEIYKPGHFNNPISNLASKTSQIELQQLLEKENYAQLGFNSRSSIDNIIKNQEHVTWFDLINILRFLGLELTYIIKPNKNNYESE